MGKLTFEELWMVLSLPLLCALLASLIGFSAFPYEAGLFAALGAGFVGFVLGLVAMPGSLKTLYRISKIS